MDWRTIVQIKNDESYKIDLTWDVPKFIGFNWHRRGPNMTKYQEDASIKIIYNPWCSDFHSCISPVGNSRPGQLLLSQTTIWEMDKNCCTGGVAGIYFPISDLLDYIPASSNIKHGVKWHCDVSWQCQIGKPVLFSDSPASLERKHKPGNWNLMVWDVPTRTAKQIFDRWQKLFPKEGRLYEALQQPVPHVSKVSTCRIGTFTGCPHVYQRVTCSYTIITC